MINFHITCYLNFFLALDPAQPNFKASQKNERVDIKSGQFVVVLHTSTSFLGLREPVGHVDFYFNGGQIQPSCSLDTGKTITPKTRLLRE
jgi:hypothetical protein